MFLMAYVSLLELVVISRKHRPWFDKPWLPNGYGGATLFDSSGLLLRYPPKSHTLKAVLLWVLRGHSSPYSMVAIALLMLMSPQPPLALSPIGHNALRAWWRACLFGTECAGREMARITTVKVHPIGMFWRRITSSYCLRRAWWTSSVELDLHSRRCFSSNLLMHHLRSENKVDQIPRYCH